jgi:CO/xanthine dehydrogenase Mo-binding subunit
MQAAAEKWGVPVSEVTTEPSVVVHKASNRRMTYGEIAKFATVPAELPNIDKGDLKKPSEYRIIGQRQAALRHSVQGRRQREVRRRRERARHGVRHASAFAGGWR